MVVLMNRSQLDCIVSIVNLAILSLTTANPDHELLDALSACGIDEAELGTAHEGLGSWFWYPMPPTRTMLVQYSSGRLALIGG